MTKQSSLPISLLLTLALLIVATLSQAQNEQKGFSFQGYARDFDGAAFSSQTITARFSIYPDGQSVEYTEDQTLETDAFGVFQAIIGSERPGDFATVDFSSAKYFVTVEVKAVGGDFMEIADTELQAVPYAKAAENAINSKNADKATTADNGNPAGTVISFAGATSPIGYLVCDGSSVLRADYPDLFAALGTAWGSANAAEFNLPDLRGQFLRGQDQGEGVDPNAVARTAQNSGGNSGDNVGSVQADIYGSHNHSPAVVGIPLNSGYLGSGNKDFSGGGGTNLGSSGTAFSTAYSGGAETRPKNAYVLFVIKY